MPPKAERVLITGAAGFIGQSLASALFRSSPTMHLVLTDITPPPIPADIQLPAFPNVPRVRTFAADLTSLADSAPLFLGFYTAVYLLHGIMSTAAEKDLPLGWKVNFDSMKLTIDTLCHRSPGAVVVFASSLAVYGPTPVHPKYGGKLIREEETCPMPRTSHGAQKLMVETYLCDLSRKGLVDGRVARLPAVMVRSGTPTGAASSWASDVVRETVAGRNPVLPVGEEVAMWVCSPETAVESLIVMKDVSAEKLGEIRVVNTPGIVVSAGEILRALEKIVGRAARRLVVPERDERVEKIVGSWPLWFDTSKAERLGIPRDVSLEDNIRECVEKFGRGQNGA